MINTWIYAIISVTFISLLSFLGLIGLSIKETTLRKLLLILVSTAAGALLGDVFIHLIPEMATSGIISLYSSFGILLGILVFFILEKVICWRHCHVPTSKDHPHPLGIMNLIGGGLHNFTDGVMVAVGFLTSPSLGWATTLAIIFHEIPQEIGDFSVLIYAGFTRKKALFYNFLSACFAIFGTIATLIIGLRITNLHSILIPITAGGFIYVASSDLIPELKKEEGLGKSAIQLAGLSFGIFIMWLLKMLLNQ